MTELLKNRRRRVVGCLTIISAFEKLLIFKSSAPFSFPFLFFPLPHPFVDSFQPLRTCSCSEKERDGIRKQQSPSLPWFREESGKELLLSYSLASSQACDFIKKAGNFVSQVGQWKKEPLRAKRRQIMAPYQLFLASQQLTK